MHGVRARLASALRSVGSAGRSRGKAPAEVVGMVEEFTRRRIHGWISVPAAVAPVRVDLWLGRFLVSSTYASPDSSMSGWGAAAAGPGPGRPDPGSRRRHPQLA